MPTRKHGGQPITRIFLKGGEDLAAALLPPRGEGGAAHPELCRLLQEKYRGAYALEILHEPCGRSDLLAQQLRGAAPGWPEPPGGDGIAGLTPDPGTRLLEARPDAVVLSVQPDLVNTLWRSKRDGSLLYPPPGWETAWPAARRRWLEEHFSPVPPLPAETVQAQLREVVGVVKARLDAHVILCGASTFDPADRLHRFHRREDSLAVRIQRCNLALLRLSVLEGISLIDVDRLLAELGARRHVPEALRYSPEAQQAIRTEFLRVLEDIGFFTPRPLLQQLGCGGSPA